MLFLLHFGLLHFNFHFLILFLDIGKENEKCCGDDESDAANCHKGQEESPGIVQDPAHCWAYNVSDPEEHLHRIWKVVTFQEDIGALRICKQYLSNLSKRYDTRDFQWEKCHQDA